LKHQNSGAASVYKDSKVILDVNEPVTEDDTNCDYSALSAVNQTSFMKKILDAQQARRESMASEEAAATSSAASSTPTPSAFGLTLQGPATTVTET